MQSRRAWNVVVVLIASSALLAACGGGSSKSSPTTTGGGVTVPTSGGGGTTVTVVLDDTSGVNGPMTMKVTPATAPAGKVTFVVRNEGTIKHEMVVLKTDTAFDQLTVTHDRVSESSSAGEAGDVEVGKTKSVTLDLKAGNYALVCNIAKHYGMGMRAAFSVT